MIENMDVILIEWEEFVRRFWQGPLPGSATLRDEGQILLTALAADVATAQGDDIALNKASLGHAHARVKEGLDVSRMIAEFRAMRAAVTRVWRDGVATPHKEEIVDLHRFHEALDQLMAASVTGCIERVDQSRRLSLGILGHELRQPLYSIMIFTEILSKPTVLPDDSAKILCKVKNCCDSMGRMLGDLLDFTTLQLGCAMRVHPVPSNLEEIWRDVLYDARAATPGRSFRVKISGDLNGQWDMTRLRQLCSNLLANANQYGSPRHPVTITLRGSASEVALAVHNMGEPIPQEYMASLFEPLVQTDSSEDLPLGRVGLGLYLCRQIVIAHEGSIEVESSVETGTTMTVILPKRIAATSRSQE